MRNHSVTSQHGGLEISSNGVVDCLHSALSLKIRLVFILASLWTADVFPVVASRETKAEKPDALAGYISASAIANYYVMLQLRN